MKTRARQLRKAMTPAEQKLWRRLRLGELQKFRFRRQHPVGRFILDFFCPRAKLVIEIDGDSHDAQAEYDAERTRWLSEQKQYRVLRFTNEQVHQEIESVLRQIFEELGDPHP